MHTFSETGAGVPAFLAKLWRLVDDTETNNLICWSKDGRSFIIQNQAQFARELLPLNYKHNNMASFIRQLNMYGFHKITSIDNGGLKFDRDEMEFSHPCFKRNCPYLLEHIKRKIANTKSLDDKSAIKPEAVSKVLQDVKAMRGRQDSLDSRFSVMKQENEALWREIASLRQKHAKQQQIVNKVIQFLITIVQPSRNMTTVKRHMQLMINGPENAKLRKTSESDTDGGGGGPVIHELSEELLDEDADSDSELMDPNSPYANMAADQHDNESHSPTRPHSGLMSQNYDYSNQSVDDVLASVAGSIAARGGVVVGGGSSGGKGVSSRSGANTPASIIQSVNPDGSKIVYHVTEVSDTPHPQETTVSGANLNNDENNVLTTPLVREDMTRSQMLKQKNKQRRNQASGLKLNVSAAAADGDGASTSATAAKVQRTMQQRPTATVTSSTSSSSSKNPASHQIQVKAEQEIDPMLFLNVYPENRGNLSEKSLQSSSNMNSSSVTAASSAAAGGGSLLRNDNTSAPTSRNNGPTTLIESATDLYNSNDFIASDMPADIFEDSSLISGGDNSNFDDNFKLMEQQQYGRSTANSGKFSSFIAGNNTNSNENGASTSAASSTDATNRGKNANNDNNMAVTKFKSALASSPHLDILRDDVHGHLENVQDELESLKDLLRNDNYSLDANTLMGSETTTLATQNNNRIYLSPALDGDFFNKLFNDADILGSYGLNLSNEGSNDRKGSELMAYQPIYDFSDIIDINNKNELEAEAEVARSSANNPSSSRQLQTQSSVLNTPYHE